MEGRILIDGSIVTAKDSLNAVFKANSPLQGQGKLTLSWKDSYGRLVAEETKNISINGDSLPLELPLSRAIAMLNYISARLEVGQTIVEAPAEEFIVTPEPDKLDDYHVVMYFAYKPEYQAKLLELGITNGQIQSRNKEDVVDPMKGRIWWEHNIRFYCDQIAVPFYAAYHTPALKPINKYLIEAKLEYRSNRKNKDVFIRHPSFHDQEALESTLDKIRRTVEGQSRYKPLMYTTDECGVADLVCAWDFDFDPRALTAMRKWLLEQYGSLEAINSEWGTSFSSLDKVEPFTTDEILARKDGNLSPWADHRFFMNKTFAEVVRKGTEAAHSADKDAKSGLVGCQMPSAFGGYNYWLLSKSIDVIEPYNIGNNREILRSFATEVPAVTTSFGNSDFEIWRLWFQALHGDRGIIIFEDKKSYLDAEGNPTEIGAGAGKIYKELEGGIVKQLAYSKPEYNPVAIHYSHASITAQWIFERLSTNSDWIERGSGIESKSDFLRLRESFVKLLEDNMTGFDFVAYEQLENGAFEGMNKKVLILPQSVAMSEAEVNAVSRFVEQGGTVIADCRTAIMDGHCKMLKEGQLDSMFGIKRRSTSLCLGSASYQPVAAIPEEYSWAEELLIKDEFRGLRTAETIIELTDSSFALYRDYSDTPVVILNNYGKGKAIYLNITLNDYSLLRLKPPAGDPLCRLMAGILRLAGVETPLKVSMADGTPPSAVELFRYDIEDMKMIAFHRNYQLNVSDLGPPEYHDQSALEINKELVAELGNNYEVYESRTGRYLGRSNSIRFELDRLQPSMYTLMKEPVEALEIEAPAQAERGRFADIKLKLICEAPGSNHVFRIEITGPDGAKLPGLTRNLLAPCGEANCSIPFALSDPQGIYTILARDAATGVTSEFKLLLK